MSLGRAASNATPTELHLGHRARRSALVMPGNLALTIKAGSDMGVAMMGLLFTLHTVHEENVYCHHIIYESFQGQEIVGYYFSRKAITSISVGLAARAGAYSVIGALDGELVFTPIGREAHNLA
jgi:hypothetical protein